MKRRRDPMDTVIESALQPGRFIDWKQGHSFIHGLSKVEHEIEALVAGNPERTAYLYETFVAACNMKADEIDDSDGKFGLFVSNLLCGWIKARQAAAADAYVTAQTLLSWMEKDDFGFCSDLKSDAAKVLDRTGLASFERAVRAHFESACLKPEERVGGYYRDFWGQVLRSIYAQQRNIEKYLALTARTSPTQADCEVIATIFQAKRKPDEALVWLGRGIEMDKSGSFMSVEGYRLPKLRRQLLAKLGRESEALDSAWAAFLANPSKFTFDELFSYVPKPPTRQSCSPSGSVGVEIFIFVVHFIEAVFIGMLALAAAFFLVHLACSFTLCIWPHGWDHDGGSLPEDNLKVFRRRG